MPKSAGMKIKNATRPRSANENLRHNTRYEGAGRHVTLACLDRVKRLSRLLESAGNRNPGQLTRRHCQRVRLFSDLSWRPVLAGRPAAGWQVFARALPYDLIEVAGDLEQRHACLD
eukprot:scaffold410353_cov43-Prasinocladus_malaysianus.AAC.1